MTDAKPGDRLFEIALYLVTCAPLSVEEPVIYGSFRLIEGASRLIDAMAEMPGIERDDFLERQREAIDRNKSKMVGDTERYQAWLTELAVEFASEAVRRNRGGG